MDNVFPTHGAGDEEDFSPFNSPTAPSLSAPRRHMEHLDLNSQADGFPNIFSYQKFLHADEVGEDHGLPPRAPGRGRGGGRVDGRSSTRTRSGSEGGRRGGVVATRGGRRGSRGGSMVNRGGSSVAGRTLWPEEQAGSFEEEDEAGSEINSQTNLYDKANWSEENTHIFCELAVEQIREGNCLNGTMSGRGYNAMRQGRRPDGTIIASAAWWKRETKKKPECKKFMYGVPTYVEQLGEMFHGVTVDGSTSYIPGEGVYGDENGEDGDGEGFVGSPMSNDSRKRESSTTDTTSSPPKKSKSPMLKMFQRLLSELQVARSKEQEVLDRRQDEKQKKKEEAMKDIDRCLDLIVEAGAGYNSQEFFVASKLFSSEYNRHVFLKIKSKEDRLEWLKWNCKDNN
ncbi:hypothetical protein GUJ93_ZPchr0002g25019 [Zizania palustris]|uniref:Myb/SANT-like domain-containing protein n=1 Tax=Zizania palustris TaxID=103762 RepID=A0A8J5RV94_ZIZPA|nr:hypothetical protein GUJ93_ZPchr0002g25019 [Zizania palustris]